MSDPVTRDTSMPNVEQLLHVIADAVEGDNERAVQRFLHLSQPTKPGGYARVFTHLWALSSAFNRMVNIDEDEGHWAFEPSMGAGPVDSSELPSSRRLFGRWLTCALNGDIETAQALYQSASDEDSAALVAWFIPTVGQIVKQRIDGDGGPSHA